VYAVTKSKQVQYQTISLLKFATTATRFIQVTKKSLTQKDVLKDLKNVTNKNKYYGNAA